MATMHSTVDNRETASLIASDKVEGTPVLRSNGERIGKIERVMIDKLSGKVAYAVMSFGGFLGIGEDYYPLPWSLLTYNPRLEGYEVNVSEQQLKGAPKYSKYDNWDWSDRARATSRSTTITARILIGARNPRQTRRLVRTPGRRGRGFSHLRAPLTRSRSRPPCRGRRGSCRPCRRCRSAGR